MPERFIVGIGQALSDQFDDIWIIEYTALRHRFKLLLSLCFFIFQNRKELCKDETRRKIIKVIFLRMKKMKTSTKKMTGTMRMRTMIPGMILKKMTGMTSQMIIES